MFDSGNGSIGDAVDRLSHAQDRQSFASALSSLRLCMKNLGMDSKSLIELEKRAYYLPNEYSDKDTKEKMDAAKKRAIEYMEQIMNYDKKDNILFDVLDNFYLFLENLLERKPHKSGGIKEEYLANLKIKNEYDIQHLLYAYLKPLYPLARAEVSEDTGYSTVRTDIFLDAEHVIEVKCTRATMKPKKLIEEIEADMIHYSAKNIYFFIYDKEKIIDNPLVFKENYETKVIEKKIQIIIHQSKIL